MIALRGFKHDSTSYKTGDKVSGIPKVFMEQLEKKGLIGEEPKKPAPKKKGRPKKDEG